MSQYDLLNQGMGKKPPDYPLGWSISDRVSVTRIKRRKADNIYQNHHSYLPRGRKGYHYGVMLDSHLVGAITFDAWPSESEIRGWKSENIREVARVCIANNTPNLASCSMAKAQDEFLSEHGSGIELLVTYVREDYDGTMFAALKSKGWMRDSVTEPSKPGNRKKHDIHNWRKVRWVCEL